MAGMAPASLPHLTLVFGDQLTLTAEVGSFTLSGQDVTLTLAGRVMWPAPFPHIGLLLNREPAAYAAGSFTLTGSSATLKTGRKLVCAAGSFTLSGQDATLTKVAIGSMEYPAPLPFWSLLLTGVEADKTLPCAAGSFTVTGVSAGLYPGYSLTLETGSFTVSGAPAERDMQITAEVGAFTLTGVDALLMREYDPLSAGAGAFTLTGLPAGMSYEYAGVYHMDALPGIFVVSELDPNEGEGGTRLTPSPRIHCEAGSFTVTGMDAGPFYFAKKDGGLPLRLRYKRKYIITIDGQDFVVNSPEEAEALLQAAEETAKEVVAEVPAKPLAEKPKTPRIRVSGPPGPELTALVDEVAETRNEIRRLYEEAIRAQEIAYYLRLQDDEEALEAILLH